jgi:hypothetical protein
MGVPNEAVQWLFILTIAGVLFWNCRALSELAGVVKDMLKRETERNRRR